MLHLHGMHTLHIEGFFFRKINYIKTRMMLSFTHLNPPHLIYFERNIDVDSKRMCIFWLGIFVDMFFFLSCMMMSVRISLFVCVNGGFWFVAFVDISMWSYAHCAFILVPHSTIEWVIERNIHIFTIISFSMFFVSLILIVGMHTPENVRQSIYTFFIRSLLCKNGISRLNKM